MIRFASALVVLASASRAALADPAAADRLAAEASAAASASDYKTAAAKFAAAYQEDPRAELFCNIGISYFKADELPRAHLLLQLCVERSALDLAFKDNAKAVVASIEQSLRAEKHTPVTIHVAPENATLAIREFGPESRFVGTRTIWLAFGTHHVEARLEGYVDRAVPVVTADPNPRRVEIRLEKPASDPTPTPTPTPAPSPEQPRTPDRPSKLVPIATTTITVAAIVVAFVAQEKADAAAFRSQFAIDDTAIDEDEDEVSTWNTVFGTTTALAVVGAAASGYLWYRALRSPSTTRVEVTPTAGGAAAVFTTRF